jgi:DNA repair protein RadD
VQVLTSCALISEGLDVPAVTGAILLRPTQSLALAIQQMGRALRPKADGVRAVILDHAGLIHRHGLPCTPRDWRLTHDKRKRKAAAPVKMCRECQALVPAGCCECPECHAEFETVGREPPEARDGELVEIKPRLWAEDGRPAIQRSRREIDDAVRACRNFDDLKDVARALGFKKGWAFHTARGLGWRELKNGLGFAVAFEAPARPASRDGTKLDARLAEEAA